MTRWRSHAAALVDVVRDRGVEVDAAWADAFVSVPRHVFVPRFYVDADGERLVEAVEADDPGWLREVYSDKPLVTRRKLVRAPGGGEEYVATSSSSQPTVIAVMLGLLDVREGMSVLEIGTGTGYHAALLGHRLGDDAVVSVDLDPELIAEASVRLATAGRRPRLVAGDGTRGFADGAPYDRIVVTAATDDVHPAWIEQLAPGGRIVAPLVEGGALIVCDKTAPGRVDGRIDAECAFFMPLRGSLDGEETERHMWRQAAPELPASPGDPGPQALGDLDFRLWLGLALRHVQYVYSPDAPPAPTGRADRLLEPGALAAAWREFVAAGRPDRTRYGLTATTEGGWIWLDEPGSEHRWPLPL
ncbi:methyltransferase domain-containing protein [Phytomonospora endophytica]|uniref:Protein-L-isoaspartate O-methyltransferase n=1 Tax=Phytomonospora endophytica TaxID=714109 RepID=A0A841FRP7_9ACTN|nr:methyltransferase domain-containing protein [Phytomonospora endophytica]MBB6036438.1 protein-L-isoaspartate(D-aspartate) O-methyltransferase [Phytomonospora endophytica]